MTKTQHFSSNGTCTIWTNGILAFDEQTQLPNAICTLKNIRQFFFIESHVSEVAHIHCPQNLAIAFYTCRFVLKFVYTYCF